MMLSPYVMASLIPFVLSLLDRFKKKLTVMGMIGHIQGMQTANRPPIKPMSRIYIREWSAILSLPPIACSSLTTGCQSVSEFSVDGLLFTMVSAVSATSSRLLTASSCFLSSALASGSFFSSLAASGALPCFFSSHVEGGRQLWSLQAPYSKKQSMSYSGLVNFTFCTNVTAFSK